MLDVVIPILAIMFIFGIGGVGYAAGGERAGWTLGVLLALAVLIAYIVWAIRLFAHGTTPVKQMLNMHVVREDGQRAGFGTMLFREWIGKIWISGLIGGLGYLWLLVNKDRQGWHDKLASTYVVAQNR